MQLRRGHLKIILATALIAIGADASAQAARLLQGIWQSQRVVEASKQTETNAISLAFIGPNRFMFAIRKDATADTDDETPCAGTFQVSEAGLVLTTTRSSCPTADGDDEKRFGAEIGDLMLVLIYPSDGTRVIFRRIGKPMP